MSDIHNMTTEELAKTIAFHTSYSGSHVVNSHLHELTRRLEAAEAKAATYWAECEASRLVTPEIAVRSHGDAFPCSHPACVLFRARAATDAARGGAE